MIITDIEGKDFEFVLWCGIFKCNCENIAPEDKKRYCHGCCSACTESEQIRA